MRTVEKGNVKMKQKYNAALAMGNPVRIVQRKRTVGLYVEQSGLGLRSQKSFPEGRHKMFQKTFRHHHKAPHQRFTSPRSAVVVFLPRGTNGHTHQGSCPWWWQKRHEDRVSCCGRMLLRCVNGGELFCYLIFFLDRRLNALMSPWNDGCWMHCPSGLHEVAKRDSSCGDHMDPFLYNPDAISRAPAQQETNSVWKRQKSFVKSRNSPLVDLEGGKNFAAF